MRDRNGYVQVPTSESFVLRVAGSIALLAAGAFLAATGVLGMIANAAAAHGSNYVRWFDGLYLAMAAILAGAGLLLVARRNDPRRWLGMAVYTAALGVASAIFTKATATGVSAAPVLLAFGLIAALFGLIIFPVSKSLETRAIARDEARRLPTPIHTPRLSRNTTVRRGEIRHLQLRL